MDQQDKADVLGMLDKYQDLFRRLTNDLMSRSMSGINMDVNPINHADSMVKSLYRGVTLDPSSLMETHFSFLEQQSQLFKNTTEEFLTGKHVEPVIQPGKGDRRFSDEEWENHPMFNYLKQSYLLNSNLIQDFVGNLKFEDRKSEEQAKFFTRQYVNSISPTNYVLTNPEVCRDILASDGECLAKGVDNFIRDLESSPAEAFSIGQVDKDAFTLGENLAFTPGEVVFQNDLFQLIQYQPTTEKVYKRPLLIVPPFINKYYILDLDKKKSLIRWLVSQGFTVFLMSWVNPDETHAEKTFESYVSEGVMEALRVTQKITGAYSVNTVGYCIGGTVLGITASVLKKLRTRRIHSLTFLTTLFDFAEPGEVGNYISEDSFPMIEQSAQRNGYFDGRILAFSFSLLRENSLFWSFFIDNYLKGKDPTSFDILYWNSDSTNIPAEAFLYYLQNAYMKNRIKEPNRLTVSGVGVDLSEIDYPTYCLAAASDHIVLWQQAYVSAKLLNKAQLRFVLAGSGHVAGVVNPANSGKYDYWVSASKTLPESADAWFEGAEQQTGSWWNDWKEWLANHSGDQVAAKFYQHKDYPVIESAPGSYVVRRIDVPADEAHTAEDNNGVDTGEHLAPDMA